MANTTFNFEEYNNAGCFDEDSAELLYDIGVTPEQANIILSEEDGIGHYRATLGYKFSNDDISEDDVRRILKIE